ncbi:unnamed protein product [Meloidogyne enterolobii]|uniref:Uncharacterized protein n=1 Tax=Meloidogyne enterolobii TaxID=390850 RepID=A0ACB0Y690_MELEN
MLAILTLVGIACWCKQLVRNILRSAITSKDGTYAASTKQTYTSLSNAGKFLCVNQAGTTAAVTCEVTAVTLCSIRQRPGRQRGSQVVECRPSPKAFKRGNRERAIHDHHHCLGPPHVPKRHAVNLYSALTHHNNVALQGDGWKTDDDEQFY